MFSESKVTEIYCMADDFCKEFTLQQEKYMIEDKPIKHRNKPNRRHCPQIKCKTSSKTTLSTILCKWKQDSVVSFLLYLYSVFKNKHKFGL